VIAGVTQLRGQMPAGLQVPDAQVAFCTNIGSGSLVTDVMLLGKEDAR
jgi:hypothetical protein